MRAAFFGHDFISKSAVAISIPGALGHWIFLPLCSEEEQGWWQRWWPCHAGTASARSQWLSHHWHTQCHVPLHLEPAAHSHSGTWAGRAAGWWWPLSAQQAQPHFGHQLIAPPSPTLAILGEGNCWAISLKELVLKGLILALWDDLVTLVAPPVWRWE